MKYNFDEVVDRIHEPGSYSSKWASNERMAAMFLTDKLPEDRLALYLADMDFRCAPEIIDALIAEAKHGIFGYTQAPDEYFEAVCAWNKRRFGIDVKPEDISIAHGAHTAIVNVVQKLTKEGDGVIIPQPTYYYKNDIIPYGRHYCGFQMIDDGKGYYTFDWEKFEALCKEPQNTLFIIQQPHNPTGRIWTEEEVKKMVSICRANNVTIISDDVHYDIKRKECEVVPFFKYCGSEGIIMITGINKTFNLAGLAVTNVIIQDPAIKEKMGAIRNVISPFGVAACIAAYTKCDDWVDQLNDYLDECLDYVLDRFHKELPKVKVFRPEGTYILWLDFTALGLTSDELNQKIAGEAHIGFSDGAGMDAPEGTIFRRWCVTTRKEVLKDAMDRLVRVLG